MGPRCRRKSSNRIVRRLSSAYFVGSASLDDAFLDLELNKGLDIVRVFLSGMNCLTNWSLRLYIIFSKKFQPGCIYGKNPMGRYGKLDHSKLYQMTWENSAPRVWVLEFPFGHFVDIYTDSVMLHTEKDQRLGHAVSLNETAPMACKHNCIR